MPKLPGIGKPYYNADSTSLTAASELLRNCWIGDMGEINKRYGYTTICDLGTNEKVDGIYFHEKTNMNVGVSKGSTFKHDKFGSKTDITGDKMNVGTRVSFNEQKHGGIDYLWMVNDNTPTFTNLTTNTQALSATSTPPLTGSGSPPSNCTHLIRFLGFQIANNKNSNEWAFSYPNNPFQWDLQDKYVHTDKQDIMAIVKGNNTYMVCGKTILDIWGNSKNINNPFLSPQNMPFAQVGLASPYAIQEHEGTKVVVLDKDRRLLEIQGTNYKVLSLPIAKELDMLSTELGSSLFIIPQHGRIFYMLSFFQDQKTFVYDTVSQAWSEWSYWDSEKSKNTMFRANCYTHAFKWGKHLIGDISNGKVYEFGSASNPVYTDDGADIVAEIITGHINYGDDSVQKSPKKLVARIKRGVGKDSNQYKAGRILFRYRDNGGEWGRFIEVDLGQVGDGEFISYLSSLPLGSYYTRQYHFKMPDATPFVLSGVWEQF